MQRLSKVANMLLYLFLIPVPILVIGFIFVPHPYDHYTLLAESFLRGHLYFVSMPETTMDTVFYNGHYFWPNPPFPILVTIPFYFLATLLGAPLIQGFVHLIAIASLIFLLFKLFSMYSPRKDAYFWTYGFIFSTCFIGVAAISWSWYFAHVLTVLLIFLAYFLYKKGAPIYYIGLIYGAVVLTRFTASLGILFYVVMVAMETFAKGRNIKKLLKQWALLLLPFLFGVATLLFYNFVRYGTWKELGYIQNNLVPPHQQARNYGLFNMKHIPGNLYYLLLSTPEPVYADGLSKVLAPPYFKANGWGLSVFVTSPIILYLFSYTYRKREEIALLITSAVILVPILLYFGIGAHQFGYRYSLDFLPYLYILLVSKYSQTNVKMGLGTKVLLILTSVTNLYFLVGVFLE